jgi:hypothetical protein
MKLMGKCKHCDRDLLLTQLLEADTIGRCPWCGAMLVRHYTMLLPRLIAEAERSGQDLGRILRLLSGGWAGFQLNEGSDGPIEASLLDQDQSAPAVSGSNARDPRPRQNVRNAA